MTKLYLDTETYSEVPITHGTDKYAEAAEVMLFAWAIDDGPVAVVDEANGEPRPAELREALADPQVIVTAHNSRFDRTVLAATGTPISIERWRDTMAKAFAHSLPGSLAALCDILKVPAEHAKSKEGKQLIQLFCKPRPVKSKIRRATRATHPQEWAKFIEYAGLDIIAMREVDKRLPEWNYKGRELELWFLDQLINDRGVCIDTELVHAAIAAVDRAQKQLASRTQELTRGEVQAATQRDALLAHLLGEYGVDLPDMQMATLERRLEDPGLPQGLRELLAIRLQASTSSTSKYKTLARSTNADGRLRGCLQYCGASRTGRWAGRLFQPQNLPRPSLPQEVIDQGIQGLKLGVADLLDDNVMRLTSSAIRGVIIAPKGKKLVVADLSNIEGRVQAWLAGETWKLSAFRDFDTIIGYTEKGKAIRKGHDLYKLAYSNSFGIAPDDVNDDQRQVGKVQELACLGPSTQVFTDNGIKAIVDVNATDLLWDGTEWVKHKGLVSRGMRPVIDLKGLEVTADHLIKTGKTWTQAYQLATCENTLYRALATGSENLPCLAFPERKKGFVQSISSSSSVRAGQRPIKFLNTTYAKVKVQDALRALEKKRAFGERNTTGMLTFAKTTPTDGAYSTGYPPASIVATTPATEVLSTTADGVFSYTNLGELTGARSWPTWYRFLVGMTQRLNLTGLTLTGTTHQVTCDLQPNKKTKTTEEKLKTCRPESINSKKRIETYDIASSGPRNRFTVLTDAGPLIVHNCGYEGGVGAFITFAAAYNIDLEDMADRSWSAIPSGILDEATGMLEWTKKQKRPTFGLSDRAWIACEANKRGWRKGHAEIAAMWGELGDTIRAAINRPGVTLQCRKLKVRRDGNWLRIGLPSGRALCYPSPRVEEDNSITYMGVNQYTRKWSKISSYGGKFFENVCQAVARDVMGHNMPGIEDAGYKIVLSVHDELLTEAEDRPEYSHTELATLLAANPPWAQDMPLAAAGFEAYRYRKD